MWCVDESRWRGGHALLTACRCHPAGAVADDMYHRYPADIGIMKQLGIKHFRLSIAWPRIFPNGTGDQPNQAGLDFYSGFIDALLAAGITP